jgi:hypothetical protein
MDMPTASRASQGCKGVAASASEQTAVNACKMAIDVERSPQKTPQPWTFGGAVRDIERG